MTDEIAPDEGRTGQGISADAERFLDEWTTRFGPSAEIEAARAALAQEKADRESGHLKRDDVWLHWLPDAQAVTAVASVAAPFLVPLAKNLTDDGYKALKSTIRIWIQARQTKARSRNKPRSESNSAMLVLEDDLPREAFTTLASVDWHVQPSGTYRFDRQSGEWRRAEG